MGTFKDMFYKVIKEKADPTLQQHYEDEKVILNDDLITFYGMITKEAREFFEDYILTQLNYLGELEKENIFDFTFLELNKIWREVVVGGIEPVDFMKEDM